jgi:NAD(P)-dependent dehydrogenase (short-subunit alcohol dehydrogenase family)
VSDLRKQNTKEETPMSLLAGKAVVITGSGRGIGAACAQGCARRGASVVVNDVDAEPAEETAAAIRAEGGKAVACVADVADWAQAGRLIQTCIESFGKIDGLVNNAAVFDMRPFSEFNPETAEWMTRINVLGPMYAAAHAVKPMLAQKSGSIVNVTSGAHMGMKGMTVYGATKGAVASMIYTWALELEGTGVRVNGLSPFGATRMGVVDPEDPETKRMLALAQPPAANSPVIEFLLSDLAKDVHGQILRIDRQELWLYTHPALSAPPSVKPAWSAEAIAEAMASEFQGRQVACGVNAVEHHPVQMTTGFWAREKTTAKA